MLLGFAKEAPKLPTIDGREEVKAETAMSRELGRNVVGGAWGAEAEPKVR